MNFVQVAGMCAEKAELYAGAEREGKRRRRTTNGREWTRMGEEEEEELEC